MFAAPLRDVPLHARQGLELGEETEALIQEATELHKKLDRYAYGPPRMRFTEAEVDRARAAGVLIEHSDEEPLVTDFVLYQDLCRTAIASGLAEIKRQVAERGEAKKATPTAQDKPADPIAELAIAHRRDLRALAATAHAANLDLGDSLRDGLSVVDPSDMTVARFFVLCGHPHRTNYADGRTMSRRAFGCAPSRVAAGFGHVACSDGSA